MLPAFCCAPKIKCKINKNFYAPVRQKLSAKSTKIFTRLRRTETVSHYCILYGHKKGKSREILGLCGRLWIIWENWGNFVQFEEKNS
jgi:hypothetical protein